MKKILLALSSLFFITNAYSQEINFSGTVGTEVSVTAPWTKKGGTFTSGTTSFNGGVEAYVGSGTAKVEGEIVWDSVAEELSFSLDEAYIDYASSFWGFRIGRQKTAWGKADGINIVNSVFPEDLSSLTIDDSSLGIDGLKVSFYGEKITCDAYWIPFFKASILPIEIPDSIKPGLNLKNGEYGIKLSGYFSLCDLSLYGFYGWDKIECNRMGMIGADGAFPVGATVLRFETAYFPQKENLSGLAGIDWMPSDWTITAQYYFQLDFEDTVALGQRKFENGATLSVSKNLLDDTLEISFNALIGLNDFDSALTFGMDYSLTDEIKLSAGSYVFIPGPDTDGKFGAYKDLSSIYIKAEYKF